MTEMIINTITENILDIIIAVISIAVSYYIIPCIKNDLVPWLKDNHLYNTIVKLVQAVEKLAEAGIIEKVDKKTEVIRLLKEQGVEINDKVDTFIESAVKELDLISNAVYKELIDENTNTN